MRKEVIGDCTLYLGDCREILPTLGKIDAVVTDPPYGLGKRLAGGSWGQSNEWDATAADLSFLDLGRPCAIWGGNYFDLPPSRGWLVWHKPDANRSASAAEMCWTNLDRPIRHLSHTIGATAATDQYGYHPTQKPVRVMRWTIEQFAAARIILDPFMGSGTTGVAAARMGRKFVGIEMDEGYFNAACLRIAGAYAQPDMLVQAEAQAEQINMFKEAK